MNWANRLKIPKKCLKIERNVRRLDEIEMGAVEKCLKKVEKCFVKDILRSKKENCSLRKKDEA